MNYILSLFDSYGYFVLLLVMFMELTGLPAPGETTMIFSGYLVYQGTLHWVWSILFAYLGAITGITTSYWIGRKIGIGFFMKYGKYVHLKPEGMEKTKKWFERYGSNILLISYFIPGVRNFSGYFSGITEIPYKKFATNAYIGALLWTTTFVSVGKLLGPSWEKYHTLIKQYMLMAGLILGIIVMLIFLGRTYRKEIMDFITRLLMNLYAIYHSLGKVKAYVAGIVIASIGLIALLIGMIQDFFAHEFTHFDEISIYLIHAILPKAWFGTMTTFDFWVNPEVILVIALLVMGWVIWKGEDRLLEVKFTFITIIGGQVLAQVLQWSFHRLGPQGISLLPEIQYTFPSEGTMIAVITYGFAAYQILRYVKGKAMPFIILPVVLIIYIMVGLYSIDSGTEYPSDILAGYVFGGVWLSINLVLLEVYKVFPKITAIDHNGRSAK